MKGKLFQIVFRLSVIVLGISFLLFFGGGCSSPPVSSGSIEGVVTDNQSDEPLPEVSISAGNIITTSDSSGNYILNKVPVGNREVTAVKENYFSQTKTVKIMENESIELDFQLRPLSQENQRVVIVELYITMGCHSCELVEPILEQLVEEYGFDHMILVEEAAWGDYSTSEISDRYKWYLPDSADRGVPNILFNGINENWIHGYANYQTIKNKIDAEIAKGTKISINTSRSSNTSGTTISGTIENISDSTLSNLEINGMVFKEQPTANLKYSVFDIFKEQKVEISSLTPGPGDAFSFSFILEGFNWETDNVHGVIFVQAPDSPTKEILQAAFIE